jgi:ABC-type transport system substrate-binding protein
MAQLIKADLDAVGFNVTLDPLDPGSFWGKAGDGNMQLGLNQRSTFVPDPNDKATILHSITSPGALTYHETLESAPQMDALIDAGIAEQDPAARVEIYRQIQQLAIDEMMYVYLAYLTPPVFYSRRLANVPSDSASSGRVNLSGVTFA